MSPQRDITRGCPGERGLRPDENTFRVDQSQRSPKTESENSHNPRPLLDAVTDLEPRKKIAFPSM